MAERVDAKGIITNGVSSLIGFFRSLWDRLFKEKEEKPMDSAPSDEEVYKQPEESESGLQGQLIRDELKEKLESSTLEQGVEYAMQDETLNPAYRSFILRLYAIINEQQNEIEGYKAILKFDDNKIKDYIRNSSDFSLLRGQEINKFYDKLKKEFEKEEDMMSSFEKAIYEEVLKAVKDGEVVDKSVITIVSKNKVGDVFEVVYSVVFSFVAEWRDSNEEVYFTKEHTSSEIVSTILIPISEVK